MKQARLSAEQTAAICHQYSLLLHAGIGLADGAYLVSREQTPDAAAALDAMGRMLDSGLPLSAAAESCGCFPSFVPGLIRLGEQTGRLETSLEMLAEYYEENARVSGQIRRTLCWPCLVLVLMLLVVGILLVKVLPVFDRVYGSLGSRLTGVAEGLLHLGQLIHVLLPGLLIFMLLLLIFLLAAALIAPVRNRLTTWYLTRFADRGIARKFNNARFARGMAMAMGSGMGPEEAVTLSRQLLAGIPGALQRVTDCEQALRQGTSLPDAVEQTQLLPPAACHLVALGLRSGCADRVMDDTARRMMEQARQSLEDLAARVEPAVVLITSGLVGVVLLSAMLPLMNIMASIG